MRNYPIYHTEELREYLEEEGLRLVEFKTYAIQIDSMQAWERVAIVEAPDGARGAIFCLQSYNTIVSVYRPDGVHRLGRWSRTTSRQQTRWEYYKCDVRKRISWDD